MSIDSTNLTDPNQTYEVRMVRLREMRHFLYDMRARAMGFSGHWSPSDEKLYDDVLELINDEMDRVAADRAIDKMLRGEHEPLT